jgi:hypothetical protein
VTAKQAPFLVTPAPKAHKALTPKIDQTKAFNSYYLKSLTKLRQKLRTQT